MKSPSENCSFVALRPLRSGKEIKSFTVRVDKKAAFRLGFANGWEEVDGLYIDEEDIYGALEFDLKEFHVRFQGEVVSKKDQQKERLLGLCEDFVTIQCVRYDLAFVINGQRLEWDNHEDIGATIDDFPVMCGNGSWQIMDVVYENDDDDEEY